MPEFVAVRCSKCCLNQVVPKAKVFKCRICGEKQAQTSVFGQSCKAKELRIIVQQANMRLVEESQSVGFTTLSLFDACLSEARH